MGLLQNVNPPRLPNAPEQYSKEHMDRLGNVLNLFFSQINAVQNISVSNVNINVNTLPTEADVAVLRSGDIYRDTTAANVIKVKP